jgi:hypothetical protein
MKLEQALGKICYRKAPEYTAMEPNPKNTRISYPVKYSFLLFFDKG